MNQIDFHLKSPKYSHEKSENGKYYYKGKEFKAKGKADSTEDTINNFLKTLFLIPPFSSSNPLGDFYSIGTYDTCLNSQKSREWTNGNAVAESPRFRLL
jgi:hypothetical protein